MRDGRCRIAERRLANPRRTPGARVPVPPGMLPPHPGAFFCTNALCLNGARALLARFSCRLWAERHTRPEEPELRQTPRHRTRFAVQGRLFSRAANPRSGPVLGFLRSCSGVVSDTQAGHQSCRLRRPRRASAILHARGARCGPVSRLAPARRSRTAGFLLHRHRCCAQSAAGMRLGTSGEIKLRASQPRAVDTYACGPRPPDLPRSTRRA